MKRFLVFSALLVSLPTATFADAGDHTGKALLHYLTEGFHLVPIIGTLAVATYVLRKILSK